MTDKSAIQAVAGAPDSLVRPSHVRIVHIGLGAFARAHLFDYTQRVNETLPVEAQWGIAGFTGRSARMAEVLGAQDNLYTLTVRDTDGVSTKVMTPLIASHGGDDLDALVEYLRDPEVSIVTVTVTEGGYNLGGFRVDPEIHVLPGGESTASARGELAGSALGRLAVAIFERFLAGAGPLSVLSLDNIAHNGDTLGHLVRQTASALAGDRYEDYALWLNDYVGFVSTVVDRITPRTADSDVTQTLPGGDLDRAPVVTEGFREWDIADGFTSARPEWELAGAQVVSELEPFTQRKLLLLNAAHSLLAYAGLARGFATVREAIADPELREMVSQLWRDASRNIPFSDTDIENYTARLLSRFANPHLDHELAQIAEGGIEKMRIRIGPVLWAAWEQGRKAPAHEQAVASWADFAGLSTREALQWTLPVSGADPIEPPQELVDVIDNLRIPASTKENHEDR
ncbi:mannitol dehydrogenase family protein [Haematomicrobium sanguinis]|uniref:mannitol dehydrogenase family protein n=1 Tax=Haematomicrobium sanguinis TaxID=479106 RepID=UPI00068B353A|nr:mannitol dehydrogenase family protein [Haematomicrobium sanguinis]